MSDLEFKRLIFGLLFFITFMIFCFVKMEKQQNFELQKMKITNQIQQTK